MTESAEAWTQAVAELRRLVQEFRNLSESDWLVGETNAIDARVDMIAREIRRAVTHTGLWAVLLLGLLFALMLIYRAITNRFRAARSTPRTPCTLNRGGFLIGSDSLPPMINVIGRHKWNPTI